jgi:hypothetical protein
MHGTLLKNLKKYPNGCVTPEYHEFPQAPAASCASIYSVTRRSTYGGKRFELFRWQAIRTCTVASDSNFYGGKRFEHLRWQAIRTFAVASALNIYSGKRFKHLQWQALLLPVVSCCRHYFCLRSLLVNSCDDNV